MTSRPAQPTLAGVGSNYKAAKKILDGLAQQQIDDPATAAAVAQAYAALAIVDAIRAIEGERPKPGRRTVSEVTWPVALPKDRYTGPVPRHPDHPRVDPPVTSESE